MSACSSGTHTAETNESAVKVSQEYTITGEPTVYSGRHLTVPVPDVTLRFAAKTANGAFIYGEDGDKNGHYFLMETDSGEIRELDIFGSERAEAVSASPDSGLSVLRVDESGRYCVVSSYSGAQPETIIPDLSGHGDSMVYSFCAAGSGFLLNMSDCVLAIDKSGRVLKSFDYTGFKYIIVTESKIFIVHPEGTRPGSAPGSAEEMTVTELDSGFEPGESYSVGPQFTDYFAGPGDALLAYMSNILYRYDCASGSSEALVNLLTSSMGTDSLLCLKEGVYFSIKQGQPYIWQAAGDEETVVLTMAAYNASFALRDTIRAFNDAGSSFVIDLTDYSAYDTPEYPNAGLTKLTSDIISGNVPDILDLARFSPETMAAKGLLEDLKPWFDNDSELSYEDLLPCIRENAEFDGGLYELIPSFKLRTLCGDLSVTGESWSVERFLELARDIPPNELIGPDVTRAEFLSNVLSFMHKELYSEETLQCDFTSDEFLSLLEFSRSLPAEYAGGGIYGETMGRSYTGDQLLVLYDLNCYMVDYISLLNGIFSGEAQFVGFPTDSDSGFGIVPVESLGMSSASAHKAEVWEFFKYLLDYNCAGFFMGLPSARPAFETSLNGQIKNAVKNLPRVAGASLTGPVEFNGTPVDEERMRAQVESMLGKADCMAVCDSTVLDIVLKCAEGYFQGGKPVEDVAQEIQSKVGIYLAEQYG